MKTSTLACYALGICAATALVGCGGSQPPAGALGVMPQSRTSQTRGRGEPSANGALLYVADGKRDLRVFSYPDGAFIERITSVPKPWGMCSDSNGNVFVLNRHPYQVMEFAHGGTTPINTFSLQYFAQACSVDPATNDLAVPQGNSIAIFPDEQRPPQSYSDHNVEQFDVCTYDGNGNLFLRQV